MVNRFPFDLGSALRMHEAFWQRANHERPLITARVTRPDAAPLPLPRDLAQQWLDADYVVDHEIRRMQGSVYIADALPMLCPNVGPDFLGALCGCDLSFSPTTSWAKHCVTDWAQYPPLVFDESNRWWQKIREITELAMQRAQGQYLVGITDLHAGLDGLVSLGGPEKLCYDLVDDPGMIKRRTMELFQVFREVVVRSAALTQGQQGTINWMGIWHPGTWYVSSCDAICLIGAEMLESFVLPELLIELEMLDASIFHLDGPGALKHLDRLLEIDQLDGIQWVYGAGQPSAAHWIGVLKRIQDAGKCIQVNIRPSDILPLCEQLRPEGVMYCLECDGVEEAEWVLRQAEEISRKWWKRSG